MTVWLSRLTGGCRALFARRAVERELDDELRAHFEMAVEQKMAARMSRAEARRAARLEMGNLEVVKDQVRDVGWESLVDAVGRDLRDAWRSVRRSPGVTTLAVLTLALGLGSATAVFTLAHGVLFTPLPYEDPDRLVQFELGIGPDRFGISPGQYVTIEHQSRRLSGVGAFYVQEMTLTSEERPERIRVGRMTASFLPVLGVTPSLGRYAAPEARRTVRTAEATCSVIGPGCAALALIPGCSVDRSRSTAWSLPSLVCCRRASSHRAISCRRATSRCGLPWCSIAPISTGEITT